MGNWAGSPSSRPLYPGSLKGRGHSPSPQPLCSQELKGLDLEDICMVPPSVAGWRQPRGSGPRRWAPGSEGAGWHLGPSGPGMEKRASGEDMKLGSEGEPSSCPPPPLLPRGPGGIKSQAGQVGVLAEVRQRWHGRQNRWAGRTGRPPPRGRGCGAQFQRPPGHGTRRQKGQMKVNQGPTGGWAGGRA